jgi:Na+-transporting NADH:ubiquinone oxidoreductase subunit NqrE
MEKRTLGIILTLLGIAGLILAGVNFLTEKGTTYNIKQILTFGILGAVFFFAGIRLIQNTRDKAT